MTTETTADRVRRSVTVPLVEDQAFDLFTKGFAGWWPREYTWAKETLESIGLEQRVGGFCYERGPDGFTCHWGRVRIWEPPDLIELLWQISPQREPEPNPAKASTVQVRFERTAPRMTLVELEHRNFSNHGPGGADYRAAMAEPAGWTYILRRYVEAAVLTVQ
jgi:uncharacterized protein YndB with AHSA1/START domain